MKQLNQFINKLKIGYKSRSIFIKLYLNIGNLNILHFFYKKGLIKHYFIKNNEIIIYLRYINNKPLFNKINIVSKSGYRLYINKESLKFYKRYNARSALVFLYTNKGFLTLKDAEDLNVGGEISFILYE